MRWGATVASVVVAAMIAGACGSTTHYGGSGTPTTGSATTAVGQPTDPAQWVAAAREGFLADPSKPTGLTAATATCMARAFVSNIGVARLIAAGVTLADARDPKSNLPSSLGQSLPAANKIALGGALQRCGVPLLLGPAFVAGFAEGAGHGYKPSAATSTCMASSLGARSERLLLGEMVVSGGEDKPNATVAQGLAGIMARCIDWSALFGASVNTTFTPAETKCINLQVRLPAYVNRLAAQIAGTAKSGTEAELGAPLVACLSLARLAQIGKKASA
jgi:hypothetical protein